MAEEKSLGILVENAYIDSIYLEREVKVDFYLPTNVAKPAEMSLLLINDGQDLPKMPFEEILDDLYNEDLINPVFCAGIHCGPDRKNEYGTANQLDYMGRGTKAKDYNKFIFSELLPFIRKTYLVPTFKEKSYAGFSLGGLSALDIAWNHPQEFTKIGVFSGSLWWRSKGYDEGYNDETDKIMQAQIRKGKHYPWMKFFFQCGAADESEDRNKNGIIDSIDDTMDLMKELKAVGYTDDDIKYLELTDGKHDVPTWARAFPDFLKWGWGR
ncbi:MAG: esterase [Sphingobacteriales bacterium]|nr:esterase [Sphingobacteriales bacterium]MBI3720415.1 esterase [Sphingobacteriales bacterium]